MGEGKVVQRLQVKLIDNAFNEVRDLPIPTDLARQPALKPNPLSVNVEVSLELRTIPFDAGL
jgi:hypothetical protein